MLVLLSYKILVVFVTQLEETAFITLSVHVSITPQDSIVVDGAAYLYCLLSSQHFHANMSRPNN